MNVRAAGLGVWYPLEHNLALRLQANNTLTQQLSEHVAVSYQRGKIRAITKQV
jgi:hypothetical protein